MPHEVLVRQLLVKSRRAALLVLDPRTTRADVIAARFLGIGKPFGLAILRHAGGVPHWVTRPGRRTSF